MIPALLLVGVGWQRRVPLPLPLIVLWPLVLLAAGLTALYRLAARSTPVLPPVLAVLFQLSGLRIDVRSRNGTGILFWFV